MVRLKDALKTSLNDVFKNNLSSEDTINYLNAKVSVKLDLVGFKSLKL